MTPSHQCPGPLWQFLGWPSVLVLPLLHWQSCCWWLLWLTLSHSPACFCRFRQLVAACKKRWSAHRLSLYCSSNRLASCSVSWCGGGGAATGNTSSVFSTDHGGKKKDKHTKLSLTILRTGVTTNIHFLKYYYYVNRCLINICKPVAFPSCFTSLFSGCHGVPSRCVARP